MIVRYAFFEGTIKEGMLEAFRKEIQEDPYPLWCQFPGATQVIACLKMSATPARPQFH